MSALDFLKGPGNVSLDLMRLGGAFVMFFAYPAPYLWVAFHKCVMPDASFGTSYALVIGAIGAAIFAKDTGVAKANAASASDAQ